MPINIRSNEGSFEILKTSLEENEPVLYIIRASVT